MLPSRFVFSIIPRSLQSVSGGMEVKSLPPFAKVTTPLSLFIKVIFLELITHNARLIVFPDTAVWRLSLCGAHSEVEESLAEKPPSHTDHSRSGLRQACGLAQIFLCTSLIVGPPTQTRPSNYSIIVWQMSSSPLLRQDLLLLPVCDDIICKSCAQGRPRLLIKGSFFLSFESWMDAT